jgi:hypothetical protein
MDWMTMSLEARNLAYNNVAHVGSDFAQSKPRAGPPPRMLFARSALNTSTWLMLQESGRGGIFICH